MTDGVHVAALSPVDGCIYRIVADTETYDKHRLEEKANATLISAAKNLLCAAQGLLDMCSREESGPDNRPAVEYARAAVAKAMGAKE